MDHREPIGPTAPILRWTRDPADVDWLDPADLLTKLVCEFAQSIHGLPPGNGHREPEQAAENFELRRNAPYLLIEKYVRDGTSRLSSHDTADDATTCHLSREDNLGDWSVDIVHLPSGNTFEGVRQISWNPVSTPPASVPAEDGMEPGFITITGCGNPWANVSTPAATANGAARLIAADADGRPAIEVGGMLAFAYIDPDGTFNVSAELGTVDERWIRNDALPMRVTVNGATVFDAAGAQCETTFEQVVADLSKEERRRLSAALDAADGTIGPSLPGTYIVARNAYAWWMQGPAGVTDPDTVEVWSAVLMTSGEPDYDSAIEIEGIENWEGFPWQDYRPSVTEVRNLKSQIIAALAFLGSGPLPA